MQTHTDLDDFDQSLQFDDEDSVEVSTPYDLEQYNPFKINTILFAWLQRNMQNIQFEDINLNFIAFNQHHHKIALFRVALYPNTDKNDSLNLQCQSLDSLLDEYMNQAIDCDSLIIPIAEVTRAHFRLLVIHPHQHLATFYDSRGSLYGKTAEFFSSMQSSSSTFKKNYYYILETCQKYFPSIQFNDIYLGHQPRSNLNDCGPYVTEYAIQMMQGAKPTAESKINIESTRESHNEMFQNYAEMMHRVNLILSTPQKAVQAVTAPPVQNEEISKELHTTKQVVASSQKPPSFFQQGSSHTKQSFPDKQTEHAKIKVKNFVKRMHR